MNQINYLGTILKKVAKRNFLEEDVADEEDGPYEPSPPGSSSALERIQSRSSSLKNLDNMSDNPYLEVISRLTPSEMILWFTSTAHPRV